MNGSVAQQESQDGSHGGVDYAALREGRLNAGLSAEEVAAAMEVRVSYITALESGDLSRQLSPGYARSLLVRYCACVGLDPEVFLRQMDQSLYKPVKPSDISSPAHLPTEQGPALNTGRGRRMRTFGFAAIAFVLVCGIAFLVLRSTVGGGVTSGGAVTGTTPALSGVAPASSTSTATTASTGTATTKTTTPPRTAATETTNPVGATGPGGQTTPLLKSGGGVSAGLTVTGQPVYSSAPFALRIRPTGEVWLKLTDEATGDSLYEGTREADDVLALDAAGPVLVVIGRPTQVKVSVDGQLVSTPRSTKWVISADGVRERE